MRRFRSLLLAFGIVAVMCAIGAGVLAERTREKLDHDLTLAAAHRATALNEYFHSARAVASITSHSSAFADFYDAPRSRTDRMARGGRMMDRVVESLRYLDALYPDSMGEAAFVDRSGAVNARVIRGRVAPADDPLADESGQPFFAPAFRQLYGKVYQSRPYVSPAIGEWVISNATKIDTGLGVSPALVHFEVTVESLRLAAYDPDGRQRVRVVDLETGSVVVDSTTPQVQGETLGASADRSLAWVTERHDGAHRSDDVWRHAVRVIDTSGENVNHWAVVVSMAKPTGAWASPYSYGPVALLVIGLILLVLSAMGFVAKNRSSHRTARRDDLTGLANRLAVREHVETELLGGRELTVLLLDLDRFKYVNDALGHHAGDELLTVLAQRLTEALREPADLVARLGGDEFVVIASATSRPEQVHGLCERVTKAIIEPVRLGGLDVTLGASIGVAIAPEHGRDYGTLLQHADIAMYDAKRRRTGWQIYHPALAMEERPDLAIDAELRRAIEDGQLVLHYQPTVDLASGQVTAAEALVRWQHPRRGLLAPSHFVPFAEVTGSIRLMTTAVLGMALAQAAQWRAAGQDLPVAVNVSAHDVTDPGFVERVIEALAARDLPGTSLVIELTETGLLADADAAAGVLQRLTELGIRVAVDDFGAGYASLPYLRRFPVSVLKLDSSIVQGLTVDATDAALVRWTVDMAHSLGITCVAEGVEDATTLAALEELGCDQAQGFYLQRPGPAADLQLHQSTVLTR
ncbi:MAG: EAL domain-containing protein [Sporichthyaceae bacterium]|nr:EAL domain-containing protein [Sporichthyaceae bacterium]